MIVPDDKTSAKALEAAADKSQQAPVVDDPPPLYSPPSEESASTLNPDVASSSSRIQGRVVLPPPDIKPSNFISLSRPNSSVKGTWLVNPALYIPSDFLPPLPDGDTEATRKHISLACRNGAVDADIYVMPVAIATERPLSTRVYINTNSYNGTVTTRIREISLKSDKERRLPYHITSTSHNGRISVYIPRSFQGPVRVKTWNGSLRFSESVQPLLTQFSDLDRVQRSFIGNFEPSKWEENKTWDGDELYVEAKNGSVKIFFVDEADVPPGPKSQGFFSRIFQF